MIVMLYTGSIYAQNSETGNVQWALLYRYDWHNWTYTQSAIDVSAGYRFNRDNYLGFQSGYIIKSGFHSLPFNKEYYSSSPRGVGIPILLDYVHYYPYGKAGKHSVYVGADIGYVVMFESNNTMFLGGKIGFDIDIGDVLPHLMVGIQANFWGLGTTVGFVF